MSRQDALADEGLPRCIPDGGDRLSLDAIMEVLANRQRRAILRHLREQSDNVASLSDLVVHLVDLKTDRTGQQPGHDHIEAALLHIHLPKLVDTGLVDYDARSQQLQYDPHDRVEELLDLLEEKQLE